MDLVSSTLDKYLKHRFNGNGISESTDNKLPPLGSDDETLTIYNISFTKLLPCCVAIHGDLTFIAAGFENSHIYLWELLHTRNYNHSFVPPQPPPPHPSNASINSNNNGTSNNIAFHNDSNNLKSNNNIHAHARDDTDNDVGDNKDGTIKVGAMSKLLAHSGSVYSIEFVTTTDLMLSCSEDTTIRLWCLNTKCNLIVYRGHNYPIWSLTIGPLGLYFASASMDSTARLWRLDKICALRIFCGHDDDVECVKFHPNEKYIATGSSDATVRLWSTSDGKMVRLMVGHKHPIRSLSFLPNGKFLASASSDGAIKVWNLATNCVTNDLSVTASHTITFSSRQRFISTCGVDNILRLHQVADESGRIIEKGKLDFSGQAAQLIQSHFHRDNKLFVFDYRSKCKKAVTMTNAASSSTTKNTN